MYDEQEAAHMNSYKHGPFQVRLSFEGLTNRSAAQQAAWEQIEKAPQWQQGIYSNALLQEYAPQIHLLLHRLFPEELDNRDIKAACIPFTNVVFNHTTRFQTILQEAGTSFQFSVHDEDVHHAYIACCCLLLNKYYAAKIDLSKPLFAQIPTARGIGKYYRILYNTDLMQAYPTDKAPALTPEDIALLINNYDDLDLWKQFFPEQSWILKGFGLLSLVDVTEENAASIFKEKLLALRTHNFKEHVTAIFRSIFSIPDIEIGFTLVDDTHRLRPAIFNRRNLSFLLPDGQEAMAERMLSGQAYHTLMHEHKKLVVSDVVKFQQEEAGGVLAAVFLRQNRKGFILAPVIKDQSVIGILEVVVREAGILHSINAQKLGIIMPFLAEAIERLISRFRLQVEAVIQQHYTAIHPSVKWKFFHEAEKYLYHQELGQDNAIPDIVLKNVLPYYGQVDVKGSGRQRNDSIKKDLYTQFNALLSLLTMIKKDDGEQPAIAHMMQQLQGAFGVEAEEQTMRYLDQVHAQLSGTAAGDLHEAQIREYLQGNREDGVFHEHRRTYAQTIEQINENLSAVLLKEQQTAQNIIPHYFEYYKTDGVEHILYAGRSITPHVHVSEEKLKALRLWQVRLLCHMQSAHEQLKHTLPCPLDVTCLLLVYQHPLTLRFRVDEKRFDVDGTYNVRFEVLKKRIDKALIKDTDQRITQPGILTIVYAAAEDEKEYLAYCRLLQQEGLLEQQWEIVEVQELQDVSGLKAIRIAIA